VKLQFLDTNIFLYSISRERSEWEKQQRAWELIEDPSNALSVQVLQEFYVQSTRATRKDALTHEQASQLVVAWSRFPVQNMTLAVLQTALRIRSAYQFSYWESAIVAAALEMGCERLYTEDLNHGQMVEGLRILNPFL
jgi:predicted nucleic acid-binding protein